MDQNGIENRNDKNLSKKTWKHWKEQFNKKED